MTIVVLLWIAAGSIFTGLRFSKNAAETQEILKLATSKQASGIFAAVFLFAVFVVINPLFAIADIVTHLRK